MILKKLSLKDFECYSGSHESNQFNFKHGINFIIGNNGSGKSKLFDAFYWVLYDQIFNTDTRIFSRTSEYKERLISDKARANCKVGDMLYAEVIIHVEDAQSNEYRLRRVYGANKISENEWHAEERSKLIIDQYKVTTWQTIPVEKHISTINRVIPDHLKPYMWFQGEQVDGLMDFQSKTSLMQAVRLLSDISNYDDLIEIAETGHNKAKKESISAQNKSSKNTAESARITKLVSQTESKIDQAKIIRESNISNRDNAQINIDKGLSFLETAQSNAEKKQERNELVRKIQRTDESLNKMVSALNNHLFDGSWILKGAKKSIESYSSKFGSYYLAYMDIVNPKKGVSDLPVNIPPANIVQTMLDKERCFVCDRVALKGSDEFKHIESHLRKHEENVTNSIFPNDCMKFFQSLVDNNKGYERLIGNIDKDVATYFSDLEGYKVDLRNAKADLDANDAAVAESIAEDNSETFLAEFRTHQNNLRLFGEKVQEATHDIANLEGLIAGYRSKLQDITGEDLDPIYELSEKVYAHLVGIAKATRLKVFEDLIREIESSANNIFQDMTTDNASITGRLKLRIMETNACIPEIVDDDGIAMVGMNDSVIILIKLSLIMAIVTARGSWSENYCLITDAPTAKMASEYSSGFYRALGSKFKQSIVMTYDFLDPKMQNELATLNLGSVHRITPLFPMGNKENRVDLEIKIDEVVL